MMIYSTVSTQNQSMTDKNPLNIFKIEFTSDGNWKNYSALWQGKIKIIKYFKKFPHNNKKLSVRWTINAKNGGALHICGLKGPNKCAAAALSPQC